MLQVVSSSIGLPTLVAGHLSVHSRIDPAAEGRMWASKVAHKKGLVVCYGLGLGYHVQALLGQMAEDAILAVVDPEPLETEARKACPDVFQDSRFHLVKDWTSFQGPYRKAIPRWTTSWFCSLPAYKVLFKKHYEEFSKRFHQEMQTAHTDVVTSLRFCYEWQRNSLNNMPLIRRSQLVSRLFGKWKGPAAVISSGPSLEGNLNLLRENQNRLLVVAVGSALEPLKVAGIQADLCVSFDGGWDNYWGHFAGVKNETPLVWDPIIHPRIPQEWAGPLVLMGVWPHWFFLDKGLGESVGHVQVGPSVALTALDLCLKLGAKPIFLVGQDLAYLDGMTHCSGAHRTMKEASIARFGRSTDLIRETGIKGRSVLTTGTFKIFQHSFWERLIGIQDVYNSGEGLEIEGAPHRPLSDVVNLLTQDLAQEKRAFGELVKGQGPSILQLTRILRGTLLTARRLLSEIETCKIQSRMEDLSMSPLWFCLQPAWEAIRSDRDEDKARRRARRGLDLAIPHLEETLERMTA